MGLKLGIDDVLHKYLYTMYYDVFNKLFRIYSEHIP